MDQNHRSPAPPQSPRPGRPPRAAAADRANASTPPDRLAWPVALCGLVALAVAMGIGRFAFTPQLPLMQTDFGLSLSTGGWLAGANYLGYLVGALLAGRQAASPQRLMHIGLWAVVASTAAMAMPGATAGWLAARFIAGVASAWVLVGTAATALTRLAELGRPDLGGVVFTGVGAGIALAGLLCHAVALGGGGATAGWGWLALLALAGALCVTWVGRPRPPTGRPCPAAELSAGVTEPAHPAGAPHAIANQPSPAPTTASGSPHGQPLARDARRLVLCYGLFGLGYILPATYLPAQARLLVPDPALFGWIWPVFGLAAMLSTLASGLLGRWSRRYAWAGAQAVMAFGVILPALSPGLTALVVAALCVGGTFMLITLFGLQEARACGGRDARRLMAAMTAAFATGQLAGPLVANALQALGLGLDAALWLGTAGLLASSLLLVRPTPHPLPETETRS